MSRSGLLGVAGVAAVALLAGSITSQARNHPAGARRKRRSGRLPCRVVVVGAGFGGLAAADRLAGQPGVDLTVIDARSNHLCQPLLCQVATAALAPEDIASPVRDILPVSPALHVLRTKVVGVARGRGECCATVNPSHTMSSSSQRGAQTSYFGHADWASLAPSLKTVEDALGLCHQILEVFGRASTADTADREQLLTFVLIGGGPTGVEMAGAIAELAHDVFGQNCDLPQMRARIILVEAGSRLLSAFPSDLSSYAEHALRGLAVEIITGTKVTAIVPGAVHLGGKRIAAASVIWTAGTEATPVAEWLGVKLAHGGRVAVGRDLRVDGHADIAVVGDVALVIGKGGKPLPAWVPVAKQQGRFVANAILRRVRGRPAPGPFVGTMARWPRSAGTRQSPSLGHFT